MSLYHMQFLSKSRQEEIDIKVQQVLDDIGLKYPDNDLIEITKAYNINVHSIDTMEVLGSEDIQGVVDIQNKTIFLNKKHPPAKQTFTLAHELGHYFLHSDNKVRFRVDKYDYDQDTPEALQETEANYFAASLLMPSHLIKPLLQTNIEKSLIAGYFGVSLSAVLNREKWIKMN